MSSITLNRSTSLENIKNIDNSSKTSFPCFSIIFFFYLLLLLVVSNLIAGLIRGYKRSLSYLRINIILSLNHALVEIGNTYVTFVVSRFGHFNFFPKFFLNFPNNWLKLNFLYSLLWTLILCGYNPVLNWIFIFITYFQI